MSRNINAAGRALIKSFESCKLVSYKPLPSDPWTIGWGHTGAGVHFGLTITQEKADQLFEKDLAEACRIVEAAVRHPLTDNQFAALVSFVYNVGAGRKAVAGIDRGKDGFVTLRNGNPSTLLRRVNAGQLQAAADQFLKWTLSAGQVVEGLKNRRAAERKLFLTS